MRVPSPTASAGDSHINHRGGESKQLPWCASGEPGHAHIPSQHVLACSKRGCTTFAWSPRYCTWKQQFLDHQANHPLQHRELPFSALPFPSPTPAPSPCSDGEGMHHPLGPRGWRMALPWPWVPGVMERVEGAERCPGAAPQLGKELAGHR